MKLVQILPYWRLMRFDKPIGFLLLLWPVLWALWIASAGVPSFHLMLIFSPGVIITRAAGCVINDIADRGFDGKVARTRSRPLVNGDLSLKQALILFIGLMVLALSLVLLLNPGCWLIALIAAGFIMLYPFSKRYIKAPQLMLGLTFNSGILMAFVAVNNSLPASAWLIYLTSIIWTLIYDTFYAMTDMPDDQRLGLNSTAILFGRSANIILFLLQVMMFIGLIVIGLAFNLTWSYWLAISLALFYGLYLLSLSTRKPFKAFLRSHYIGLIIFIGILLSYS